ncbi:hypothetical protein PQU92_05245 [Asticcacaulis sp. BYS171W]|uniref:Uncharacterized protein n=1 Tax=Asticcacaulis aquaticus TaxID=2984212 RepID=A0ABT5HS54_9CAUL|nr:hypothetical protein [Asticcacaulis aquaticus]MDC7682670.1 hypothetical protein [Asticcacaulis aquaticus]
MSYYEQDIIAPVSIHHGLDYGVPELDGSFGFLYNFIDYRFEADGQALTARHYLDQFGVVSLTEEVELTSEFAQSVLVFLAMRFSEVLDAGQGKLPEAITSELRSRLAAHMAKHAIK